MINYILANDLYFKDYVIHYTNASFLVNPEYRGPADLDGLFSGYNEKKRNYDKTTWLFQKDENGLALKDPTLQDPNCVFQLLKKHYVRYTPEKVSAITGTPLDKLLEVYKLYGSTGKPDRVGTECYAMGWTQHTVGTQNIRAMTIIQQLLGNMGMAGGGINALRGEPNVQGSTDHAILYNILPGYLKMPTGPIQTLAAYNENIQPSRQIRCRHWYQNYPKYAVKLPEGRCGAPRRRRKTSSATPGCRSWMTARPARSCTPSMTCTPARSGASSPTVPTSPSATPTPPSQKGPAEAAVDGQRQYLRQRDRHVLERARVDPQTVGTEVFLLPAAASMEKAGSQSNSGRWVQWRYQAANPPGDALSDGDICMRIMDEIRALYAKEGGACPEPILNLKWDYRDGLNRFDVPKVAKWINGQATQDFVIEDLVAGTKEIYKKSDTIPSFAKLQADGNTACGNWLMAGSFDQKGENKMQKRGKDDPTGLGLFPDWSYAWPLNRRIIYNRASCDLNGKPYDPKRKILEWVGDKWVGDVPDGPWPPMANTEKGKYPFIMKADGVGAIFGPGMAEGPFPEHYEPLEGPLAKNPLGGQLLNPVVKRFKSDLDVIANADEKFPYVCTSYSCTEHWCSGFTRWQPWLLEAMPEAYLEMSEQLAEKLGIKNGEKIKVAAVRGQVECVAMVTKRMTPFEIEGKTVHQVACRSITVGASRKARLTHRPTI